MTQAQTFPISPDETFCFDCSPQVDCFNACCRDLTQLLTPYDILRLKTHLGLTSQEFLARYAQAHTGPETGLPIVSLRPAAGPDDPCPFVTSAGCAVYDARPASCRTYPLMRGISRSRETGEVREHFMVLQEPHCRGFVQGRHRTAAQWIEDQGAGIYNFYNDRMLAIIALKNQRHPGPLTLAQAHFFQTALYDLDSFRDQFFEKEVPNGVDFSPEVLEKARHDDLALLELAMSWIGKKLFGVSVAQLR